MIRWILFACMGFTIPANAIWHGETVNAAIDPLVKTTVAVITRDPKGQTTYCTGTLIRSDVVLTAGHCVPENFSEVFMFVSFFKSEFAPVRVTEAIAHPDYQIKTLLFGLIKGKYAINDIGLLRLEEDADAFFTPAHLPNEKLDLQNKYGLIAGYGITSANGKNVGTLRKAKVFVSTKDEDGSRQLQIDGTPHEGLTNICGGDSGGPVFARLNSLTYLVGVHSWASCQGGSLARSEEVSQHLDWINKILKDFKTHRAAEENRKEK